MMTPQQASDKSSDVQRNQVGFAFSERYLNQRHTSLVELLKARTDSAVCSNPADSAMIRSRIQDKEVARSGPKSLRPVMIFEERT